MCAQGIILNHAFYRDANKYYARPVIAARYQLGMENGWMVRYHGQAADNGECNLYEGAGFFPDENSAWDFSNAKGKQCVNRNGMLVEMEVSYENPLPVLYREVTDGKNKGEEIQMFNHDAFLSDESCKYDYSILEPGCWIIQELDGTIRVWDRSMEESFFGGGLGSVYVINGNGEYIQVLV